MNDVHEIFYVFGFIILVIAWFCLLAGWDRQRIRNYLSDLGGELLHSRWDPLGPGWIGDRERPYKIRYRDCDGYIHSACAKTSMLSGVWLAYDEIVSDPESNRPTPPPRYTPPPAKQETVEQEKARLRKRLAELEQMD